MATRRCIQLQQRPRLEAKRLGVKRFGGQQVKAGEIRSASAAPFHPGENVGRGGDDTLFALKAGAVQFGIKRNRRMVNIVENEAVTVDA